MSGKLKISTRSSASAPKPEVKKSQTAPATHAALPSTTHGKGGVYRSVGGGKRIKL